MGHIFIGVVVAVAVIVIAPLVRRLWIGNRMVTGLLTGKFGQTPLEHELAAWFRAAPREGRATQPICGCAIGTGWSKGNRRGPADGVHSGSLAYGGAHNLGICWPKKWTV